MDCPEDFADFATGSVTQLRRTAYLLCGDWHTAEDLTQIALTKVLLAWRRIRSESVHAYAHRTLVNTYLAGRRSRKSGEVPFAELPDAAVQPYATELRLIVLHALGTLPPRARAVVVLRYWEDRSVEEVAAMLGCSPGTVKSQSARALDKLREVLGASSAESLLAG